MPAQDDEREPNATQSTVMFPRTVFRPAPLATILGLLSAGFATTSAEPPATTIPRVLIIGIDGCRPDALRAAQTPHLDRLVADGILVLGTDIREPGGRDDADTVSGPGWSNLLTGVWPDKHGVLGNAFKAPRYDRYPHVFVRLKQTRPDATTASFSTWPPIESKIVSSADVSRNFNDGSGDYARFDQQASEACVSYLSQSNPDLVFCYQGQIDEAGHKHGFHPSVEPYRRAIERVDEHVGQLIDAVVRRADSKPEDWLTIVCTDHGGRGTGHGGGREVPEIRQTFLILSGSSVSRHIINEPTFQVDVVATALAHLRVPMNPDWDLDGHAIGLKR